MFWLNTTPGRHAAPPAPKWWWPDQLRPKPLDSAHAWWSWLGSCQQLLRRARTAPDDGMSTAEYAIGTIAAAAFAAVLYTVVTGDSIVSGLTSLVEHALTVSF